MNGLPTWVYTFVVVAVVGVGLALNIFDAVSSQYAVPDAFNAVLWVVAGAAFGQRVFRKGRNGRENGGAG
jgi:hypothetical protein